MKEREKEIESNMLNINLNSIKSLKVILKFYYNEKSKKKFIKISQK